MDMGEATRLFYGTLRTEDRQVRDLLVDEQQLDRYGLTHAAQHVGKKVVAAWT